VVTFATASIASLSEQLSGAPTGSVSLLLPASSDVSTSPGTLPDIGPFAALPEAPTAAAQVTLAATAAETPSYP